MNPRDFLESLKTPSGKLLVFATLFAGAALLFVRFRPRSVESQIASKSPMVSEVINRSDQTQTVQTVERPMELYRPPTPKPEPKPPPLRTNLPPKAETSPTVVAVATLVPPMPISLVAETPEKVVEIAPRDPVYAPYGRLIPCETVITVDSASIQTPIIGLVTEDIYHAGRLVIPAGTEIHGTAQTDRMRERISSGGAWTLVWRSGEELRLKGMALDREFAGDQEGWGITDGSAGLRGRIIKADDMAEIKLFAAALLSGAAAALTEKETTLFGSIDRRSLNNAPLKGAQDVLQVFAQRIHEAIQRDGFYVRVPSGKQFYLYVLQTIDRTAVTLGAVSSADTHAQTTEGPFISEKKIPSDFPEHLPLPPSDPP